MAINYRNMEMTELLSLSPPGWGGALLDGLAVSLKIALLGYGLGLLIGLVGATLKRSGGPVARDVMAVYTTLVRAVPELVLILFGYFAIPQLLNQILVSFSYERIEISGFLVGVLVIGFVQGAYATEVLRGALGAVKPGHIEAAHSFGMHPFRIFYRITLPEMVPLALPGLSNLWLTATKDTALLAVVGFTELTLAARQAAGATKHYFLFLLAAGALYLTVTLLSGWLFQWLERYFSRGMRRA